MPVKNRKMQAHKVVFEAFTRHQEVLTATRDHGTHAIVAGGKLFVQAIRAGRRVFFCGNGGSAADSQHFAAELLCRYRGDRKPLPGIALTTDTSALTAIANDYQFKDIFSRQLEALGTKGDLLVAFSTSGRSENVLQAIASARAKRMRIIFLTGENGLVSGRRAGADIVVAVPHKETAKIQEMHELIYHAWCEYLDKAL
jgi:D-sedoheptulose 7-phosphate isomerase